VLRYRARGLGSYRRWTILRRDQSERYLESRVLLGPWTSLAAGLASFLRELAFLAWIFLVDFRRGRESQANAARKATHLRRQLFAPIRGPEVP